MSLFRSREQPVNRTVLDQINDINRAFNRADAYLRDAIANQEDGRRLVAQLAADFGIVPKTDALNPPEHAGQPFSVNGGPGSGSGPYPITGGPLDGGTITPVPYPELAPHTDHDHPRI
jgi:hypothetical protein